MLNNLLSKQDNDFLLLAAEAVHPPLIVNNPYTAGRAAILANVNDIYAMGGKPLAVVDTIISPDIEVSSEIIRGLKDGSNRYGVPIVGGHLTATGHKAAITVCILGRAKKILSSFHAQPDDFLLHVTSMRGAFYPGFQFWNSRIRWKRKIPDDARNCWEIQEKRKTYIIAYQNSVAAVNNGMTIHTFCKNDFG